MHWSETTHEDIKIKLDGIRVIHKANFLATSQFRHGVIKYKEDWNEIFGKSFLPDYKDGKSWHDPSAKNYLLIEKSKLSDEILQSKNDIVIITAYDSKSHIRLIVDGVHRSIAIQRLIDSGKNIPESMVIECYGNTIRSIFEAEFQHFKS